MECSENRMGRVISLFSRLRNEVFEVAIIGNPNGAFSKLPSELLCLSTHPILSYTDMTSRKNQGS